MKKNYFEVIMMAALCLIAIEAVRYPELDPTVIYMAFTASLIGIGVAHYGKMYDFRTYFIFATITTVLCPSVWALIEGKDLWQLITTKAIPFAFSIQTYLTAAIAATFIIYAIAKIKEGNKK